ncbi:hypothetical protein [Aminobacter sp. LjRoot7]|uniref:hypothetical protein n=1 Tax=Aminobacter sp. LjRoot7 TaxID=3342335 RepID=UPI003F4F6C04
MRGPDHLSSRLSLAEEIEEIAPLPRSRRAGIPAVGAASAAAAIVIIVVSKRDPAAENICQHRRHRRHTKGRTTQRQRKNNRK